MIARLIAASIRHRGLVIVAGLVLALWGLWAAARTPIDAIPDLSENQVIVYAGWPGHGPREVEDQVTYPLAVELQGVRGVRVVRSSSDVGYAWLAVIFEDGINFAAARRALVERLARLNATLPAGVVPRLAPDASATGQIFWYTVEGGGLDLGRLRAIQDFYVRPQLASVPGVAEVASVGGAAIEYQVEIDPVRLRACGATLDAVTDAVAASHSGTGTGVVHKANAEFVVRGIGWLGGSETGFDPSSVVRDLENVPVPIVGGGVVPLAELARVTLGAQPRRGVLEKDGAEVTGGVVLMAHGENPREVTQRLKRKIREIAAGLPAGVKIVPFYDRTPLIDGAIGTVTGTLVEAMATAAVCVLLILLHLRASFVIVVTLPLAVLGSFALLSVLRTIGLLDVQINVMSLAGIAISIGVLVDSSIVMTENAMHRLRERFGDRPVRGDVRGVVLPACQAVGRPIVFSVAIMLLSFLPVFALGGMEGKMFRPLAVTKCFALVTVAALSVTLVPALCTILLRGRIRGELDSPIVRGVVEVYRPILNSLLDRPSPLIWVLGLTFVVGLAPLGSRVVLLTTLALALLAFGWMARTIPGRAFGMTALIVAALLADRHIEPLGLEFMTPLDEGMVMDMPISVPRASVTQAADDLKARDMILCRFPEVDMVVGKAGRAETPTDPAPLDMIETMVNFRPREHWPRRALRRADAARIIALIHENLIERGLIDPHADADSRDMLRDEATTAALAQFDALMREYAHQRNQEFTRSLGIDLARIALDGPDATYLRRWTEHVRRLDGELRERAAATITRLAIEELLIRAGARDHQIVAYLTEVRRLRNEPAPIAHHHGATGHEMSRTATMPTTLHPQPTLDAAQAELTRRVAPGLMLWQKQRGELIGFGGELDRAVPMPGWTNVWTMPIQNRVDMLATGVNTALGVRLLGRSLDDVVAASEAIAEVVKRIPGAADVVADPIRGKGYVEVRIDRARALRRGVSASALNSALETAIGGRVVATTIQGRERHPVRVRYGRAWREDEESIRRVLVPSHVSPRPPRLIPLAEVADVRTVEGPATIKGENGLLRNYVRLNVRGRGVGDFVDEARRIVADRVQLPEGTYLEWAGQFEHEARARQALTWIVPIVLVLILLILYATYRDLADAVLMMLAVPGAIAGGIFAQWLLGTKFSVTVWIGYIACFGMATATGIIMLVYLREAVERAGGLERLSRDGLRRAVLDGAVKRLRPKLLTEATTLLGLAPMLWADGVGSDVIRPMAAPVLGGILIADEVIDLFLPVAFYWVRRRRWERRENGRSKPGADVARVPPGDGMIHSQTSATHSGRGDVEPAIARRSEHG
jgi:Cu(I)/Ag(I) efflux system membrane protein CusA/SilA